VLLLTVGAVVLSAAVVRAQNLPPPSNGPGNAPDVLKLSRNLPGDSKPIVLSANEVTTWSQSGQRFVLLKGKVLIEEGVVSARCQQAVAWVDEGRSKQTHILHVDVYAEGEVQLENAANNQKGARALLDLNTRGELRLRAATGKVVQQPHPEDQLFLRGQQVRSPQDAAHPSAAVPPASGVQQTSFQAIPPVGPPPAPAVPVQAPPAGGPPGPVPPPAPPMGGVAPPSLQPPAAGVPAPVPAPVGAPGPTPPAPPMGGTSAPSLQPPIASPMTPDPGPAGMPPTPYLPTPTPGGMPSAVPANPPGPPQSTLPPAPGPPAAAAPPAARSTTPGPPRLLSIAPRTGSNFQTQSFPLPSGEQAIVVTGGIILTVRNIQQIGIVDIEADKLVFWTHGNAQQMFDKMKTQNHQTRELEFYLAGNVIIREQLPPRPGQPAQPITMYADQAFYDVGRNVAIAISADLEFKRPPVPVPGHLKADELLQLSPTQFKAIHAEFFASQLSADPGFKVVMTQATLEDKKVVKHTIWGKEVRDRKTGEPIVEDEMPLHGENVVIKAHDLPIFYWPSLSVNAEHPLGPLQEISLGYSRIYGGQFDFTFDLFELLGIDRPPGYRARLLVDYLTARGPALGLDMDYAGRDFFGIPSRYVGMIKAYGIYDTGDDILGSLRDDAPHPTWRGRFTWRQNLWELPGDFSVQFQVDPISDKNFLEEYYKNEFDSDINQSTFVQVKQQRGNWAWTLLGEQRIRDWVTETDWLPRADGWLLGQSFFDRLTYNVHASAGYARLQVANPNPVGPTQPLPLPFQPPILLDTPATTGRFDLWQELSMPVQLGPVKVVPYGVVDLTEYTQDLNGDSEGRFYGAGGVRASMPLTRLYPDVQSNYLNLNGINHKIVFSANYYYAHSDKTFTDFPQLDRLNDDATDQALRDITPLQTAINSANGFFLMNSPLYNQQLYAIRRLLMGYTDTLDSMQVLQLDVRQRWQTKRGYPGMQHIVDWMTLELSTSYFPDAKQNFGEHWAFSEYDWTWNIGDRFSLVSNGWFDPFDEGARVFNIGAYFNRPDRTNFYLGYRQIDPLNSRAVTAAVGYIFSPKYAVSASAFYDFGTNTQVTSLNLTRIGADLQLTVGISYNSILNTVGFNFMVLPNLIAQSQRVQRASAFGSGLFGR
jgi:hypothetical protein